MLVVQKWVEVPRQKLQVPAGALTVGALQRGALAGRQIFGSGGGEAVPLRQTATPLANYGPPGGEIAPNRAGAQK